VRRLLCVRSSDGLLEQPGRFARPASTCSPGTGPGSRALGSNPCRRLGRLRRGWAGWRPWSPACARLGFQGPNPAGPGRSAQEGLKVVEGHPRWLAGMAAVDSSALGLLLRSVLASHPWLATLPRRGLVPFGSTPLVASIALLGPGRPDP